MQTKPLLYGLIGFFIGGFIVSVAATTFDKPENKESSNDNSTFVRGMTMTDMVTDLRDKTGDEYDQAFIASMIAHHEGAVDMARLSATNAKHDEIKKLSEAIIVAQEKEIADMLKWEKDWGYERSSADHDSPRH